MCVWSSSAPRLRSVSLVCSATSLGPRDRLASIRGQQNPWNPRILVILGAFGRPGRGENGSENREIMKTECWSTDMFQKTHISDSVPIFMPSGPFVIKPSRCALSKILLSNYNGISRSRNAYQGYQLSTTGQLIITPSIWNNTNSRTFSGRI